MAPKVKTAEELREELRELIQNNEIEENNRRAFTELVDFWVFTAERVSISYI